MSTHEALIREIEQQPESVVKEVSHYLAFLVQQQLLKQNKPEFTPTDTDAHRAHVKKFYGIFADEPFERPPQLPFEKREEW